MHPDRDISAEGTGKKGKFTRMNLEELQKAVFDVVHQPLTPSEGMRKRTLDGRPVKKIVEQVIKPNDRLTSFERLEIYNRVYWFRIISSLMEDFPGLRAIVGDRAFEKLATAYLYELPSESFSLRNLGLRLESWLRKNPKYTPKVLRLALDMVRQNGPTLMSSIRANYRNSLPRI